MGPMPRSLRPELLDGAVPDPAELAANLREMAMLNRLPGGVSASVAAVRRLLRDDAASGVVDVGTGYADFARRLRRRVPAQLVLVDSSADVLAIAARRVRALSGVRLLHARAEALPLGDAAASVSHASLLLHHLDPSSVVRTFREMRRVARRGVVVNDLRRSRFALAMTAVPVLAFARCCYTRHDGVLSARRAYTLDELDDLAAEAGLRPVARTTAWWPRVTTTYR